MGNRLFISSEGLDVKSYCNADWANDRKDRKFYSGYMITIGNSPVSWRSKKQDCVKLSTLEAEYVALGECCKEVLWLKNVAEEMDLGSMFKDAIIVYEDNTSTIKLASNYECRSRTKHIATRHHFVRELVNNKSVWIEYIESRNNVADVLTKPMGTQRLDFLMSRLMLIQGLTEE